MPKTFDASATPPARSSTVGPSRCNIFQTQSPHKTQLPSSHVLCITIKGIPDRRHEHSGMEVAALDLGSNSESNLMKQIRR